MFLITSNSSTLRPDAADTSSRPTISDRALLAASDSLTQPSSNEAVVAQGRFESKEMGDFHVELAETAEAILASDTNSRKRSRNTGKQSGLAATLSPARPDTEHSKSDICLKSRQSRLLKQHGTKSSDNRPFQCTVCGYNFTKSFHLNEHIRTVHDDTRHFLCKDCGAGFKRNSDLNYHIKCCHGNKHLFKCEDCDAGFPRESLLKQHARIHNGELPFQCKECGASFLKKCRLKKHLHVHKNEQPLQCEKCNRRFWCKSDLAYHKVVHDDARPFQCDQCDKNFKRGNDLVRHKQKHSNKYCSQCDKCGKIFNDNILAKHIQTHNDEHQFQCDQCGKTFNYKDNLTKHKKSHSDERHFQCDQCGNTFKRSHDLIRHRKTHSDERHFQCNQCGNTFKRNHDLIKHRKTHSDERPFSCDRCYQTFKIRNQLTKHKKAHDNKDHFPCNKASRTERTLTKHKKNHDNKYLSQCDKRDGPLKRKDDYRKHLRIHNNDHPFEGDTFNVDLTQNGILAKHKKTRTGRYLYTSNKSSAFTNDKNQNQPEPGHSNEEPSGSSHCDAGLALTKTLNPGAKQKNHTTHSETRLADYGDASPISQLPPMNNQTSTNGIHVDKSQDQEDYKEMLRLLNELSDTFSVMPNLESGEHSVGFPLEKRPERI